MEAEHVVGAQLLEKGTAIFVKSVEAIKEDGEISISSPQRRVLKSFLECYKGENVVMTLPSEDGFFRREELPSEEAEISNNVVRKMLCFGFPFSPPDMVYDSYTRRCGNSMCLMVGATRRERFEEIGFADMRRVVKLKGILEPGEALYHSMKRPKKTKNLLRVLNADEREVSIYLYDEKGLALKFLRYFDPTKMSGEFLASSVIEDVRNLSNFYFEFRRSPAEVIEPKILVSGSIAGLDYVILCEKLLEEVGQDNVTPIPTKAGEDFAAEYAVPIGAATAYLEGRKVLNYLSNYHGPLRNLLSRLHLNVNPVKEGPRRFEGLTIGY